MMRPPTSAAASKTTLLVKDRHTAIDIYNEYSSVFFLFSSSNIDRIARLPRPDVVYHLGTTATDPVPSTINIPLLASTCHALQV